MPDSRLPQRWTAASRLPSAPESHELSAAADSESTLKAVVQFVALLRRHWVLVFGVTAACVGILIYRVRNEQRIYRATAVVRLTDKGRELSSGISRPPAPQVYRAF